MDCLSLIPTLLLAIFLQTTDGLSAPERENLCAQARQESMFIPDAVSRSGARGWGQFMRPTWGDVGPRVGCPGWDRAFDPRCSMLAQAEYMDVLLRTGICQGIAPLERWHLAWACYNAGLGWVRKERSRCALLPGCDPRRWVGNVETTCARSPSACRETRDYVVRIKRYGGVEITL